VAENLKNPLGGSLKVRPGLARPFNLVSTRPDWVHQLTHGKAVSAVPTLLATLFNLCGQAHRLCAELAIQAARGDTSPLPDASQRSLQAETLREHLRRMTLDWPLQLAASAESRARFQAAAHQALRACPAAATGTAPLTRPTSPTPPVSPAPSAPPISTTPPALPALFAPPMLPTLHASEDAQDAPLLNWLDKQLLGGPARQWLDGWEQSPHAWMSHWCATTPLWLPELLHSAKAAADVQMPGMRPLHVHASPQDLMALAGQLQASPSFTRQPYWQDQCAETGPWTRLNQPNPERFNTPWLRLGARLAELVRLSLPEEKERSGSHWLQTGSVAMDQNTGLAWVEMARGLLVHVIQLDGHEPNARVQLCRVLAPTEWNFHPHGAVARQLENLPLHLTPPIEPTIRALMTAFDPCVSFELLP
jgi:hypothetical protein